MDTHNFSIKLLDLRRLLVCPSVVEVTHGVARVGLLGEGKLLIVRAVHFSRKGVRRKMTAFKIVVLWRLHG